MSIRRFQSGISLIELVIFIVIVGVSVAGILSVLSITARGSADPMIRKQALSIAESLLTEVEQQAFTYCDPQDANVLTATSGATCAVIGNDQNNGGGALGPTAGESRGGASPFDNVADYAGYSQANVSDITGANAMAGYNAVVTITRAGNAAPFADITDPGAVLRISVNVQGPAGTDITLVGYRFRYAPNVAG